MKENKLTETLPPNLQQILNSQIIILFDWKYVK